MENKSICRSMKKFRLIILAILLILGIQFYHAIHGAVDTSEEVNIFVVQEGESVHSLSERLEEEGVIRSAWFFRKYISWKHLDTRIRFGEYSVYTPLTLARVAEVLTVAPGGAEKAITILPGWNLTDIAMYFEEEGITTKKEFFAIAGNPATFRYDGIIDLGTDEHLPIIVEKLSTVSLEGYLRPDTFRIFANATITEVIEKLVSARNDEFTVDMIKDIKAQGKSIHDILTMASILEREVRTPKDRRLVSDLFWRRLNVGMALQADSTVHYIAGTDGSVFTSAKDRDIDSLWNTYKYPELPPGPISNPSLDSIMAAMYPESNEYWYFMTTLDTGEVKYAKTLDEHNMNVAKYLR